MKNRITNTVSSEFSSPEARSAFAKLFQQEEELLVFDYTSMDHNIQALYEVPQRSGYLLYQEFCRKVGKQDDLNRCVIDYLDDNDVQAYATSVDGFHHIGVSHALPILLQAIFQQLLSNTNPFSEDNPEDIPKFEFPNSLPTTTTKQQCFQSIEELLINTMPEAKWQKIMSTKLAEIAVLFCFSHEISHIVWGHSELSRQRGFLGVSEFRKKAEPKTKPISSRLRQAWELQADRAALGFLYSYVNNNKVYKKRLLNALKCDRSSNPTLQLMSRVTYAISFVFFLFGQDESSVTSKETHPSSITRQTFVMAQIVSQILYADPSCDEEEVTLTIQSAASKAEKAWNRLGFSFGKYETDLDDLPKVVKRLSRFDSLAKHFLGHYQWAAFIR